MANDKAESNIATTPSAGEQQADLSRQTFANPKEFLQVLESDFDKISQSYGQITKRDLLYYEHFGNNKDGTPDMQGRAAAAIALEGDHYDQLVKMAKQLPMGGDQSGPPGLTANGLALDMKIYEGSLGGELAFREAEGVPIVLAGSVATALGVALTAVTAEAPPVAVAMGALTAVAVGVTAWAADQMYMGPGWIRDDIKAGQQELGSWKEINTKAVS